MRPSGWRPSGRERRRGPDPRLSDARYAEAAAETERVSGAVQKSGKAAEEATKKHKALGGSFDSVRRLAGMTLGTAGLGGLTLGIGESIQNGLKLQEVQAQMAASIRANVQHPAADATKQMTEFADSMSMKGGFNPTQSMQAMTQFLRVTHDTAKAQSDLTLATNISRGAHVDLGRATRAVTTLEMGRITGLSKLGINVTKVTTAYDNLRATRKHATIEQIQAAKATDAAATKQGALAIVSKQFGGAMATYSKTAAGGIANLRNTIEVLSTKLGTLLLPIIAKVTGWITKFVDQMMHGTGVGGKIVGVLKDVAHWLGEVVKWVKQNKDWLEFLAVAIGGAVLAMKAWELATDAVKAAQVALNAVSDMNPWVIAIGAVIAIVILLYKRFGWFRDFAKNALHAVEGAFQWVVNAAKNVFNWVKDHWPLLLGILAGPFALAVVEIIQHWGAVKKWFGDLLHWFGGAWKAVKDVIVWPFEEAWKGIKWILNKLIDGLNFLIKGLDKIHFKVPGWVPFLGGKGFGFSIKPIGHLAGGGPVTATGSYIVGEQGPEQVVLPRGASVTPNNQLLGGNDRPIVINVILDGKQLSKSMIRQGLLAQSRQ